MYPPEKPTWEPENHTLEKESHLHTKPNFLKFSANFPGCNILFQMPSLIMQQNLLLPWNLSGIWTLLNLTNIGNIHFFSHTPRPLSQWCHLGRWHSSGGWCGGLGHWLSPIEWGGAEVAGRSNAPKKKSPDLMTRFLELEQELATQISTLFACFFQKEGPRS